MTTSLSRRTVLGTAGGLAVAGAGAAVLGVSPRASAAGFATDPFTLGVASGDPTPDGIVLWTRLAVDPLAEDGLGGMANRSTPVQWQVAADEGFGRIVRRGVELARADWAHSVHVEVAGLEPAREYWYRFKVGSHVSPVGRTKTAPAYGAPVDEVRFGFVSCQGYNGGYFTALGHAADERFDLMLHLGDYIYEGGSAGSIPGRAHLPAAETFTLADYRLRYSQYRTDPDLQACHASTPFVVVPDDHEVENNWAGDISQIDDEPDQDPVVFRRRRADAFRAMYENQPLRRAQLPAGPDMLLYRRIAYGDLIDFSMIDTRQYRDDQIVCPDGQCPELLDPERTFLGTAQERWLLDGLVGSAARWKIIGNQSISFANDTEAGPGLSLPDDNWNGYPAARDRLYRTAYDNGLDNLVIVTGDAHRNTAAEMKLDYQDPDSATVGAEFLGTSITSGGDGTDLSAGGQLLLAENPHQKFVNNQRGYQRVVVSPESLRVDFRVIEYVTRPGAPVSTRASAYVEDGHPGIAQLEM